MYFDQNKKTWNSMKMFVDLNNFLNIKSQPNYANGHVGIGEKNADSSFLIHHFVSILLNGGDSVCLLSFTQTLNHFNSVGNKIGSNMTAATKQGKLLFIDGLRLLGSIANPDISYLSEGDNASFVDNAGRLDTKVLLKFIRNHLERLKLNSGKMPNLIIDNLSVLIDFGCSAKAVIFMMHYLRSYCLDCGENTIVLGVNNDLGEEDEENTKLWNYIRHCSYLSLTVSGLGTGYSKEVHGQITARWNSTTSTKKIKEKKTQFKLTDKTCILFASGMSSAVL